MWWIRGLIKYLLVYCLGKGGIWINFMYIDYILKENFRLLEYVKDLINKIEVDDEVSMLGRMNVVLEKVVVSVGISLS